MGENSGTVWLDTIRLAFFLSLLFAASVSDLKKRMIPDSICIYMVLVSFLPPEPWRMPGFLAAPPLLLIGMTAGCIGGGDIKIVGAAGMVLGFHGEVISLLFALCSLLCFHCVRISCGRMGKKRKQEKKRGQAYPLVPFLFLGTVINLWMGG